jgi:purine nucleoside phosphorylase
MPKSLVTLTNTLPFTDPVHIAVIGGTGLQSLSGFVPIATVNPQTPWGYPSAPIHILSHNDVPIAFLSRHGAYHEIAPHEVPSRANIAALRSIGVRTVIAFSAVGSLQEEIRPRDFVVPDQVIDRTKGEWGFNLWGWGLGEEALIGEVEERGIGFELIIWGRYSSVHFLREGGCWTCRFCGSV